jgi:hypothetical protein
MDGESRRRYLEKPTVVNRSGIVLLELEGGGAKTVKTRETADTGHGTHAGPKSGQSARGPRGAGNVLFTHP